MRLLYLLSICFTALCIQTLSAQSGCPGCQTALPANLPADTLYLQNIPDGEAGLAYNQDISFRMPKTTTPVFAVDSITPPGLTISKIEIISVDGLPQGLYWEPSQWEFQTATETDGCIKICGTPTVSDSFVLTVKIKATVLFLVQEKTFPMRIYIAPKVSNTDGFSMSNFTGCGSAEVTFENNVPSGGADGFEYVWDFGDNTGFEGENPPPHTYTEPGIYTVSYHATVDTAGYILESVTVLDVECVDQLGAGLITAADGGDKLADGMKKMADGIVEGKDKLPSYSESDRENLSTVVASPVQTDDLAGLANANVGWISLVLVLALWLGALAMYAVTKAIGAGLLSSSEPTAVLIGRSLLPGAVVVGIQALVVAGLAQFGLDVSPQKWLAITGVLLLAGFTFVVLNHALVAWFGGIGRLVSIAFAVLTTADALTSAAPGLFEALRPFSPLTPALDAIRAIVTESSGATIAVLLLVGWLLLGLAASSVAIARRRTTSLTAVIAAG